MESEIKHLDMVFTKNDEKLGKAIALFSRREDDEVNPALKLYGTYLEIANEDLGDVFFVPTDFIASTAAGKVNLSIDMKTIQTETFTRKPQFVAWGHAVKQDLPE